MHWKEVAKNIPLGQRRKIVHCSTDPSAYVSKNTKGLSLYCFRCGETDFEPISEHSIRDLVKKRQDALRELKEISKPIGVSLTKAPDLAIVWLLTGGLTPEAADQHGFVWNEKANRILIPVKDRAGKITGILARGVHGEKPKYMLLSGKPSLHFTGPNIGDEVVVVEDILSSIAVRNAGFDGVALLGTHVSDTDAAAITENKNNVVAFMDPDKAGRAGFKTLRKKLQLYPVEIHKATADKDPKYISRAKLREAIHAALRS